jgi:hypothetical protein
MVVFRDMVRSAAASSSFCGATRDAVPQTGCAGSVGAWPVAAPAALRVRQVRCDSGMNGGCATHKAPRLCSLHNRPKWTKLKLAVSLKPKEVWATSPHLGQTPASIRNKMFAKSPRRSNAEPMTPF